VLDSWFSELQLQEVALQLCSFVLRLSKCWEGSMAHVGKHAIVVGAGMGGLLAARALADHFDEVTVLERDALPDSPDPRKGVPQGRHTHGLLARGREVLEQSFPGFNRLLPVFSSLFQQLPLSSVPKRSMLP
jgi:pimeloyl-ACP methyl ester carboxylesterase